MDLRQQIEEKTPQVKAASKRRTIDEIPNPPQRAVCEKHGEYEFKYIKGLFKQAIVSSTCCKCVEERTKFIDSEVVRVSGEREEMRMQEKIMQSGVSKRNIDKTFDNYIASTPAQVKAKKLYEDFASSICNGEVTKSLIVCGSVGTGKTHLASAVVNSVSRTKKANPNGYSNIGYKTCELVKIIDLIRQFKSTWSKDNDNTEEKFLDYYTNVDALIIDEVGMQFGSDTEKMVIFDIIDGRYNNMLPTALISNLELPEVQQLIDPRAIDRLREDGGVVVAMSWESHRGLK